MLKKIYLVLIIFILFSALNFSMPIDETIAMPGMVLYEFRIVDVSADLGSKIDLKQLIIAGGSSENDYLSLIPVTDSTGTLKIALRNIFAELNYGASEKYYHLDSIPEIVTTMGNPGSLSIQKDKLNIPENTHTNEVVLLSVLPEREDAENHFFSRLNVYIAGEYSVRLTTKIKHKENEWVPVAIVRFTKDQKAENISGEAQKTTNRYTVLFLRAQNIAFKPETSSEKELFVWSDMSGLDKLFNPAKDSISFQSSYIRFLFGFNQSGLAVFSGELAALVTQDFLLGAGLSFDTQNSSITSLGLSVGVTGEDGLLLKLSGSYVPEEVSGRKLNLSLGFEDSTHPTEMLKLSAAWYPLTIYPFETENIVELTNHWSFEAGFVGKTGIIFSTRIDGYPVPDRISAVIGYSTGSFEFSVGFSFELNSWE